MCRRGGDWRTMFSIRRQIGRPWSAATGPPNPEVPEPKARTRISRYYIADACGGLARNTALRCRLSIDPANATIPGNVFAHYPHHRSTRGIGFAAAKQLADRGAHVIISSRDAARAKAAANALGAPAMWVALDLTDPSSIEAAVQAMERRTGQLDVLVNNAAVLLDHYRA